MTDSDFHVVRILYPILRFLGITNLTWSTIPATGVVRRIPPGADFVPPVSLSLRNVGDLVHERGVEISPETVRFWRHRFGPMFASEIRKRRIEGLRSSRWRRHFDENFVKISGERHCLWRAVDHEGEALESCVTKTRDKNAALKFLRNATRKHGRPEAIANDKLRSDGAALKEIGAGAGQ